MGMGSGDPNQLRDGAECQIPNPLPPAAKAGRHQGEVTRRTFPTRPRTERLSFFRRPQDRSHQVAQRPGLQRRVEPNMRQKAGRLLGVLRCEWEGQLLQAKYPLLNSCGCVCMHACLYACPCVRMCVRVRTHVTPGAPPRRAGGEVASASRCSCRSSGGGRTPGKGCPSGPARGGGSGKGTDRNT